MRGAAWLLAPLACALTGCPPEPAFPADYQSTYQQVYGCEGSAEHSLMFVRAWADEVAAPRYDGGAGFPVPAGAVVVKEEFSSPGCADLVGYAVMRKEADGSWFFQTVDDRRRVTDEGAPSRCTSCHRACGKDTDGLCAFPGPGSQ